MDKTQERDFLHLNEFDEMRAAGKYRIPTIRAEEFVPSHLIDFNAALRSSDAEAGVHFFLDDSRFERIWKEPYRYIKILQRFTCVLAPDFSLYMDMSLAMKIWNVYRSRLLGQMMQEAGIRVIPTVSWAEPATYDFCFDGISNNGTIAISSVGCMRSFEAGRTLQHGFAAMQERLTPTRIILYGKCPEFMKNIKTEIYQFANTSLAWKTGKRGVSYKESI